MEMWQGIEAESSSSSSRDWDERFNLFTQALASEKDALKIRAMVELGKMSRHAPQNILELALPMLLELLQNPQSELNFIKCIDGRGEANLRPLVLEASAYCLRCISARGEGALVSLIGQPSAISIILNLLPNPGVGLQRDLLKCLRNVVTFWPDSRAILVSHNGLQIVLNIIDNSWGESKLVPLEILTALALIKEVRRTLLLNSSRVHLLVGAARFGSMISKTRAAQGALPVLIKLLEEGDPPTKIVAGNALGVFFSCIERIRQIASDAARVISLYVELLVGSDIIGKEIAVDVLCVLAALEENAIRIIEQLVRILRGNDPEAKAAAADIIWDIAIHKYYSSPLLQNSGAIPILVELLEDESVDVIEKASGAIAQLSQDVADRAFLANCGVIPRLLNVLDNESDEVRDNAAEALVNLSSDSSLGDQISCIIENPAFQDMCDRVMLIRASNEHLRQIARDQIISRF